MNLTSLAGAAPAAEKKPEQNKVHEHKAHVKSKEHKVHVKSKEGHKIHAKSKAGHKIHSKSKAGHKLHTESLKTKGTNQMPKTGFGGASEQMN
ncbi:hypothetical protein DCC85_18205 [Paenibacillus sp. CAA11]|uniref:hypothetical protein n=1 Tax=Paenibacillus sp. CAA11 TaxID=1532905 RepID=UPI000D3B1457|nr:hypothetical protein [Paenibacillus sp. CAA11]AWB47037.1 hypothetical protein DCC85_18205 [Paenibacillus sp. CAA11]